MLVEHPFCTGGYIYSNQYAWKLSIILNIEFSHHTQWIMLLLKIGDWMACMGSLVDNFDNSNIVILMFIIIILMFLGYIIIHIFSGCSNICVCWQCYNSLEWTQMSTLQQKQFFLHVQPSRSQLNMSRRKSFYVFFKKPTWSNMINYSWSSSMRSD